MNDLHDLRLLQLADSGFPTGGFAFSNGLEGLADLGFVRDRASIEAVIRVQIEEGLARVELPALLHAHAAAEASDLDRLTALDRLLTALKPVPAFHAASVKTGRRFVESAAAVYPMPIILRLRSAILAGELEGHHAVAFGAITAGLGIPAKRAALAFASLTLHGQVAAAVRLGLIGQRAAQAIITNLHPALARAVEEAAPRELADLGGYGPLLDLAGLLQPDLDTRLFAS